MRYRFTVEGSAYSEHKDGFKDVLKRHGLRWKGTRESFVWSSRSESVTAFFERDEARDVTVRAEIAWEGRKKTPFLTELKEWVWSVGGSGGEDEGGALDAKAEDAIERELFLWDAIHRPDEARLRAEGRPEAWIERDLRAWKRKRAEKKREIAGRLRPG